MYTLGKDDDPEFKRRKVVEEENHTNSPQPPSIPLPSKEGEKQITSDKAGQEPG